MLRKPFVLFFIRFRWKARHHEEEELLLAHYKLISDMRNSHSSSSFSAN